MSGATTWILDLAWWPVLERGAWTWDARWYPAALGAVAIPATLYAILLLVRRRRHRRPAERRRIAYFAVGVTALLLTLAWPLGRLATVMLAARTAQYLILTLAVAPLFLLAIPRWPEAGRGLLRHRVERLIGSPKVGAPLLGIVVVATHTGGIVDAEGHAAIGALVRAGWLVAGLVFWWPLVGPGPERERLPYLGALGYMVLPFLFPKLPGVVYVFSEDPLYAIYRGALRPGGLSDRADQGLAGFLFWLPGSAMVVIATWLLFRHWARDDRRLRERDSLAVPVDAEAIDLLVQVPGAWQALEELVRAIDEALPPADTAAELAFVVGPRGRVTLVVRLHANAGLEAEVRERIQRAYAAHLRRAGPRRDAIEARLAVEVEGHGSRVQ